MNNSLPPKESPNPLDKHPKYLRNPFKNKKKKGKVKKIYLITSTCLKND